MGITITKAPCCRGVDDIRNPHLSPWERVSDEAADVKASRDSLRSIGF